jgi:hypothetical protein
MLGGQKIPYKLDLACPIALPIKSGGEPIGWPITWCALLQVTKLMSSAAQIEPDRTVSVDIHDLYLAALFLPEDLFPLTHYTADLIGHLKALSSVDASSALTRCMLALPDIEHKHRRCLLPVLAALADVTSAPEIKRVRVEDAVAAAEMDSRELEAVKAAMALRMGCRAVEDGHGVVVARRIAEEYERRE